MRRSQGWMGWSRVLVLVSLWIVPHYAHGQEGETIEVSRRTFWEAVRTECAEQEAKASQYDVCRANLSEVTQYRDELHGQIDVYQQLEKERLDAVRAEALMRRELEERWKTTTWLMLVGGGVLLGLGGGILISL